MYLSHGSDCSDERSGSQCYLTIHQAVKWAFISSKRLLEILPVFTLKDPGAKFWNPKMIQYALQVSALQGYCGFVDSPPFRRNAAE